MTRRLILLLMLLSAVPAYAAQQVIPDFLERYHRILQKAYANSSKEMEYARLKGAMFTAMPNGDGVSLYWEPAGASKDKKLLIVLPDASTDAWKEFRFWHPIVERHDTALLIPQWEQSPLDVLRTTPHTLYPIVIQPAFISRGFKKGSGILYARGKLAMFGYGMAALDRRSGGGEYLGNVIIDDGSGDLDDPIVQQINAGVARRVFNGSQWAIYCSSDCAATDRVASWLLFQGGEVGFFQREPENKGRTLRDEPERLKKVLMPLLPAETALPAAPIPKIQPAKPEVGQPVKSHSTNNFAKSRNRKR